MNEDVRGVSLIKFKFMILCSQIDNLMLLH